MEYIKTNINSPIHTSNTLNNNYKKTTTTNGSIEVLKVNSTSSILNDERIKTYIGNKKVLKNIRNNKYSIIELDDGSVIKIINNNVTCMDKDGKLLFGYHKDSNNNLVEINIFDDYSNNQNQYGGNQNILRKNADTLLRDDYIYDELEKTFPNSTNKEKIEYLNCVSDRSCGFVGKINSLFRNYIGKEKEFYDTFGFNMYNVDNDGNIDFNYEYLTIQFYDYAYAKENNLSINEYFKNAHARNYAYHSLGDDYKFKKYIKDYYNVDCDVKPYVNDKYETRMMNDTVTGKEVGEISLIYNKDDILNVYKEISNHDDVMIGAEGYRLIDYETGNELIPPVYYSHDMTVIGEENNNLIVSSYGKKYILDLDYINNNGRVKFFITDYK